MAIFTSKTYFDCIDSAASYAASFGVSLTEKIILFCEDKLTLSLENALVEKAGGAFGAEVLSFGRYAGKVNPEKKSLSKEGSAMVVKKILANKHGELKALGALKASPSLANKTAELIAQLKSAKVTPDLLFSALKGCPESVARKLGDIALVYSEYENFLAKNDLTDSNNCLQNALSAIENDEQIKNARIIIVGYSSVTKQTCAVIEKLNSICRSCDFFAVDGDNKDLYIGEFLNFVKSLTKQVPTPTRHSLIPEAEDILDRLFCPEKFSKVGLYSDKVHIFEAKNLAEEVDYICAHIRSKIVGDGLRYKDIAIGVGNFSDYSLLLCRKLSDYGIPYFADAKRKLSSHPLCKLACSAVRCSVKRRDLSEIKKVVCNGLFISNKKLADKFIRLLTQRAVTVNSFVNGDDFIPQTEVELTQKRNALANFISDFPKVATAETFAEKLRDFTVLASGYERGVGYGKDSNFAVMRKNLEDIGASEEIKFLESASNGFFAVLDEITRILGKDQLSADEFLKILSSGLEAGEVALIPEYNDCVYLSEIKNLRFKKYPCVYVMGLSGDVPFVKPDTALLLDSDISKLDALEVAIEPKIRVVNKREKEATALAFASFSQSLTLSHSLTTASGKATVRSEILDYIENIFTDEKRKIRKINALSLLKPSKDPVAEDYRAGFAYSSFHPAMLSLLASGNDYLSGASKDLTEPSSFVKALENYDGGKHLTLAKTLVGNICAPKTITAEFPVENYFAKNNVSPTTIEAYHKCPYKCFISYGLGVTDSLSAEIRPTDFGNILHALAEKFMPQVSEIKSEEDCLALADKIITESFESERYSKFLKRADNAYSAELTKKEGRKLCLELYRQYKNSKFRAIGHEVWIDRLPLNTEKGNFKLTGKVDRVDKYGDYVRIVDYKTGNVEKLNNPVSFYTGQSLQLYLYLNAFAAKGAKPAGGYYYGINDNFSKPDDSLVYMHGKTLNDPEVLTATDPNFADDKEFTSSVIQAGVKFSKGTKKFTGSAVSQEVLQDYMKYAKLLTEQTVNQVLKGVIIPSPYSKTCAYCEFGSMCGHDGDCGFKERHFNSIKASVISEAVATKENTEQGEDDNGEKTE